MTRIYPASNTDHISKMHQALMDAVKTHGVTQSNTENKAYGIKVYSTPHDRYFKVIDTCSTTVYGTNIALHHKGLMIITSRREEGMRIIPVQDVASIEITH